MSTRSLQGGLRAALEAGITALGTGFLRHKGNKALLAELEAGELDGQDFYKQLIRLAYRIIFLVIAEDPRLAALNIDQPHPGLSSRLWRELRLILSDLWERGPARRSASRAADLSALELADKDLLAALRVVCNFNICSSSDRGGMAGADELGRVYESLLELHPVLHKKPARFELGAAAGRERKATGSYYTPPFLVDCLLDSALEPALDEAAARPDPERAILDLKVCDPACGAGHFLVAAARRIARRLASARAGGLDPSPVEAQRALRDVVEQCIYGVDLSPVAVDLCRFSLWMEASSRGEPLRLPDSHIREGNALFGATPEQITKGIPDEAFEPIEGDNKEVAKRLKKRNRAAREAGAKTKSPRAPSGQEPYDDALARADAWCSAFVWPKREGPLEDAAITDDRWRQVELDPRAAPEITTREVQNLAREYSFFHWHLAFPQVFSAERDAAGFDVVLGNPPWDTLSPDAKEFFSAFDASVRTQAQGRQAAIIKTLLAQPAVAAAWERSRRRLFGSAHFFKVSGRFTMFAPGNLGKGDINVFRMFVELALRIARDGGRVSQIVPDGLYSGANSAALRRALLEEHGLTRMFALENVAGVWFPGVHRSQKFCLFAAQRGRTTSSFEAAFGLRTAEQLAGAMAGGAIEMPVEMVKELSPEALAIIELGGQREIDIATRMYRRWPKFGDASAGAPLRVYMREIDMGNDRALFSEGGPGLPVYEGRMVGAYDHRAKGYRSGRGRSAVWNDLPFGSPEKAIRPQWHIPKTRVPAKVRARAAAFRVGFCDVASPTNERTLCAALLPRGCVAGHTVPTIVFGDGEDWYLSVWLGVANSFCMDFLARQKATLHMTYTLLDSLPFPRLAMDSPIVASLAPLVLRLSCTGPEMIPHWNAMARHGWVDAVSADGPPPGILDEEPRLRAIAEVEAIVAHDIFGLSRDELAFVMDSFPIVAKRDHRARGRYHTKELVLGAFDRRAGA